VNYAVRRVMLVLRYVVLPDLISGLINILGLRSGGTICTGHIYPFHC